MCFRFACERPRVRSPACPFLFFVSYFLFFYMPVSVWAHICPHINRVYLLKMDRVLVMRASAHATLVLYM